MWGVTKRMTGGGALILAGLMVLSVGCGSVDPTEPEPPTGGQEFVLDPAAFAADVAPVLSAKGCDTIACHGGGRRGSFELSPFDDKDLDFDFAQAVMQVDPLDREASNLLAKPLDESVGGDVHTAPTVPHGFASTADPDYQAILAWIREGEMR